MERLRWLPAQFADRFIVVNVPEFRLRAFDAGSESPRLTMGVVVGSAARGTETPIMHADMRYVIFQPIWTVPDEIVREEILPEAREGPHLPREAEHGVRLGRAASGSGRARTTRSAW